MTRAVSRVCVAVAFAVTATFIGTSTAQAVHPPLPTPAQVIEQMRVPDGFFVTAFASEPDIVQPIGFNFDDRGRLWVVECPTYPDWSAEASNDRIVILEDTNGDGVSDHRRVFWDNAPNVTSVAWGFGGAWVISLPRLIFIPDRDRDGKPDGPPQVHLDGFALDSKHLIANGLTWGPDGWLYGRQGRRSQSLVGPPGSKDGERVAMRSAIWRYHPVDHRFEVVARGTVNPWGLDFDEYGQMFITSSVVRHLYHVPFGAFFDGMANKDQQSAGRIYELMQSCADHLHWAGGHSTKSRGGEGGHGDAGGGHAHVGCMVYLGNNWPRQYRGDVFICNLHGHRLNHDALELRGSGYNASHRDDFLLGNSEWFWPLDVKYGPDGGVYVSDWAEHGKCHQGKDRQSGRIFKVTYGKPKAAQVDLAKLDDAALVRMQHHDNEWYVRHARRLLQERAAAGTLDAKTASVLKSQFEEATNVHHRLRDLWALWVTGKTDDAFLLRLTGDASDHLRGWAVRLLAETHAGSKRVHKRFAELARSDESPRVRLALASAARRIAVEDRWPMVAALAGHAEDAGDANIPLMLWYAIEPLVADDPQRALILVTQVKIPKLRTFIARRVAEAE